MVKLKPQVAMCTIQSSTCGHDISQCRRTEIKQPYVNTAVKINAYVQYMVDTDSLPFAIVITYLL